MRISPGFLLLALLSLASCAGPNEQYVQQHPQLPPAQKQFLRTGKIDPGEAVAGLTHAEVKLAMRGFPDAYDKINGDEAWVYRREKLASTTERDEDGTIGNYGRPESYSESSRLARRPKVIVKTTVIFQGDRATRLLMEEEAP